MKIIIENRSSMKDSEIVENVSRFMETRKDSKSGWVELNNGKSVILELAFNKKSIRFVATDYKP